MINPDNTQEVENIEEIENKYWYDLHLALTRLETNKDFQLVIEESFFKDRAVNGVSMLADRGVVLNNHRKDILEELVAISHLKHFFLRIHNLGTPMPDSDEDEYDEEG